MDRMLSAEDVSALKAAVDASQRVVATCHVNPDGDAIGSLSAVVSLMTRLGKEAVGITPNIYPDNLKHVPGSSAIVVGNNEKERAKQLVENADLIFCLDYNAPQRAGDQIAGHMSESRARKVMIDHHLYPDNFCDISISRPEQSSTCETLLRVMSDMGWADGMTQEEAAALYVGIMTDTGVFTYASSRPELFESVATLMRKGIDKDKLYHDIYQTCTEGRLRLMGYMLYVKMEVMRDKRAVIMTLTNEEYRRFAVKNGDTEGFVNMPLQMDGVTLSIFLRQDTEERRKIRVSARSLGEFPCNKMAEEFFNGGGHKNAAGGSLICTMGEAVETARRAINKYAPLLKQPLQ